MAEEHSKQLFELRELNSSANLIQTNGESTRKPKKKGKKKTKAQEPRTIEFEEDKYYGQTRLTKVPINSHLISTNTPFSSDGEGNYSSDMKCG